MTHGAFTELVQTYVEPAQRSVPNDPQRARDRAIHLGYGMLDDAMFKCIDPDLDGSTCLAALSTCEQMDFEIAYCTSLSHETKMAFRVQFGDELELAFKKFSHYVKYGNMYEAFKECFRDLLPHLIKVGYDKEGVNLEGVAPVFKEMKAALAKHQERALQMRLVNPQTTSDLLYLYYEQAKEA